VASFLDGGASCWLHFGAPCGKSGASDEPQAEAEVKAALEPPAMLYFEWRQEHVRMHDLFIYPLCHLSPRAALLWLRLGSDIAEPPSHGAPPPADTLALLEVVRSVRSQPTAVFLAETLLVPNLRLLRLVRHSSIMRLLQGADLTTWYIFELNQILCMVYLAETGCKLLALLRGIRGRQHRRASAAHLALAFDAPHEVLGVALCSLSYSLLWRILPLWMLDVFFCFCVGMLQPIVAVLLGSTTLAMFLALAGLVRLDAQSEGLKGAILREASLTLSSKPTLTSRALCSALFGSEPMSLLRRPPKAASLLRPSPSAPVLCTDVDEEQEQWLNPQSAQKRVQATLRETWLARQPSSLSRQPSTLSPKAAPGLTPERSTGVGMR